MYLLYIKYILMASDTHRGGGVKESEPFPKKILCVLLICIYIYISGTHGGEGSKCQNPLQIKSCVHYC